MLAEGHLLIEDVPGVGKTSLAKALAASIDCTWKRVQFTPDLLPTDVVGVTIWNRNREEFEFKRGPVFANIVLGDEINRASPKTQSALLEAMEERQVTVDAVSHQLEAPFMVIATQNPIDHEGTYPLPDSQLDRFLMRISLGYPARAAELEILDTHGILTQFPDPTRSPPAHIKRWSPRPRGARGAGAEGLPGRSGRRQPSPSERGHRHVATRHLSLSGGAPAAAAGRGFVIPTT
jgi:MoxR-like ATPase